MTGLPVTRIVRTIDPLVRRSAELGFLNGHVPVTAIITRGRPRGGRPRAARRRRAVQRVVGLRAHPGDRRARREPPVVQERRVRAGVRRPRPLDAGARHLGVLLPPPAQRAVGGATVRRPHPVPPRLSQLQPRLPPGPGAATRPLVRPLRQVLLHRPRPRPVHGPRRARSRVRRRRAPAEPRQRGALPRPCWAWARAPSRSSASGTPTNAGPPWCWPPSDRTAPAPSSWRGCAPSWPTPRPPTPPPCCSRGAPIAFRIAMRRADLLVRAR